MENVTERYIEETLDSWIDTELLEDNISTLRNVLIGNRITKVKRSRDNLSVILQLHTGDELQLAIDDRFMYNHNLHDQEIVGVGTERNFTLWHLYCELGDVFVFKYDWDIQLDTKKANRFDITYNPVLG